MLIQTVIGNEVQRDGQTKVHIFVCPTHHHPMPKEQHLFLVASGRGGDGSPPATAIGSPQTYPALNGMDMNVVGKWSQMTYELPDNVLLKLMISRSTTSPPGQKSVSLLLRTRETAALRRIMIDTIPNPRAPLTQLTYEGKFDIVDLQTAAAMGFHPSPQYLPTYLPSRWARLPYLRMRELAAETVAQTRLENRIVRNTEGQKVEVQVARVRRALDV